MDSKDSDGNLDYIPSKPACATSGKPTTLYFYRVLSSDGTTKTIALYYVNSADEGASTLLWAGSGNEEERTAEG